MWKVRSCAKAEVVIDFGIDPDPASWIRTPGHFFAIFQHLPTSMEV